jgi:5'-nucleotidase/UDP-sugar diphosphatase
MQLRASTLKKLKHALWLCSLCAFVSTNLSAQMFSILHTNDRHSRLLGFGPESDYHPKKLGDGTIGGIAA